MRLPQNTASVDEIKPLEDRRYRAMLTGALSADASVTGDSASGFLGFFTGIPEGAF
jgi:hypothetical protein